MIKKLAAFSLMFLLVLGLGILIAQDKGPDKVVYKAKTGDITFLHAKHTDRLKGDCTPCHDKLFPKTPKKDEYSKGMHKPAEAAKTSCAGCHVAGGTAFESKGNCTKCHVKPAA